MRVLVFGCFTSCLKKFLTHFNICAEVSYCDFNLHFITNDVENIFKCFLHFLCTYTFFLVKYLFKAFVHHLFGWLFSYYQVLRVFFYCILDTSHLTDICFANNFSLYVAYLFILLTVSFVEKFLILMKCNLLILL